MLESQPLWTKQCEEDLHDPVVEDEDDEAGDVEGGHRRHDDEIRVVKLALQLLVAVGALVEPHQHRHANGDGHGPDDDDGAHHAPVVVALLLLRVLHRL